MAKKSVAIISLGRWGRRIAQGLATNRAYHLRSLIGWFPHEPVDIPKHAEKHAPVKKDDVDFDRIADTLVEHGIVPTREEAEGDTEDAPRADEKTIDIVILDMGDLNDRLATLLRDHVRDKILVRVVDLQEKKQLELIEDIVEAVCPDIESADRIVNSLTGKQNPSA